VIRGKTNLFPSFYPDRVVLLVIYQQQDTEYLVRLETKKKPLAREETYSFFI
jgi:hypothetical protein